MPVCPCAGLMCLNAGPVKERTAACAFVATVAQEYQRVDSVRACKMHLCPVLTQATQIVTKAVLEMNGIQ